jgi:hypothetical protein
MVKFRIRLPSPAASTSAQMLVVVYIRGNLQLSRLGCRARVIVALKPRDQLIQSFLLNLHGKIRFRDVARLSRPCQCAIVQNKCTRYS